MPVPDQAARTLAILPVKSLGHAKQRLGSALRPDQRRLLAAAMVSDVLTALGASEALTGTVVVTGETSVADMAAAAGVEVVPDPRDDGQSAAAMLGIARAIDLGASRVLLVPGDCPALDPLEVDLLLSTAAPGPSVTVVPDRHGTGTNALLIAPPDAMGPSFGPDSFERHREGAERAGLALEVARPPSLLLDIDTAADLEQLRTNLDSMPERAVHTRATLQRLD